MLTVNFPNNMKSTRFLKENFSPMPRKKQSAKRNEKRIQEALEVLEELGLPREQINQRSALTLLALLDLKSDMPWQAASSPLMGITPMMTFFSDHYDVNYAPNTRETVRRYTVHHFLQAGLVIANPDHPSRPVNSPKAVYQIELSALELLKSYGTPEWPENLNGYQNAVAPLKALYSRERQMQRIPVVIETGPEILLSPGGQNVLIKRIIDDFCPLYTPGGKIIYIGDTEKKWAYFDADALTRLNVAVDEHGKMPDIVVFFSEKNWLILIEAVTSHGPVNAKRHKELMDLFRGCTAGLVFVTAFLTRRAMVKYLSDISWETEVWVAEAPTHMIHFNGERFLGPY
jgi:hypothetical protein